MNKFFQIIVGALTTVVVIAVVSCGEENEGEKTPEYEWPSKHMIQSYILPDSLENLSWSFLSKDNSSVMLGLAIGGERIYSGENPRVYRKADSLYYSFVEMYHDTAWYGTTNYMCPAVAYPVSEISIISDADYNDTHPAGCELIDIAKVNTVSYGNFVLNGYTGKESQEDIFKPFSEYTQKERSLWWRGAVGIYLPLPTLSRIHNFTVTFSFDGWKSVSSTVHVEL
ncbi:MAG: hypothetical protein J6T67_11025 [Paludibacteraceae bacterium]|nr:hypothetical protein [Paludibacteraceae bacterium]